MTNNNSKRYPKISLVFFLRGNCTEQEKYSLRNFGYKNVKNLVFLKISFYCNDLIKFLNNGDSLIRFWRNDKNSRYESVFKPTNSQFF